MWHIVTRYGISIAYFCAQFRNYETVKFSCNYQKSREQTRKVNNWQTANLHARFEDTTTVDFRVNPHKERSLCLTTSFPKHEAGRLSRRTFTPVLTSRTNLRQLYNWLLISHNDVGVSKTCEDRESMTDETSCDKHDEHCFEAVRDNTIGVRRCLVGFVISGRKPT